MLKPTAVLSYTRKDDDFFGGYITAFRAMLETAVHVVTGEETFRVFQDVEGIIIGEQWQKKLANVIGEASFLVPMVSPLFFNSRPCREEVDLFLAHERELRRDDLILPIYFLSCAKLEKAEEKAKDPLATELARRQMFDWRKKAKVPLKEPEAKQAILELAGAVAGAIERLGPTDVARTPATPEPTEKPRYESLAADPRLAGSRGADSKRETLSVRRVLWVDDKPDNNVWERRALESYGVRFVLAGDTDAACRLVQEDGPFAAIISDMGRPGDREAGYTLLRRLRDAGVGASYFIYSSSSILKRAEEARSLGACGATNDPDKLVAMVLTAIR